ncbi:hypothetical protein Tco_1055793 [Tanacetum coccineum]|uniref:Homeodomain-like protein n=1 Tax=Tanacetum coccineum TaxID=301880 RepID=A0ABQ5H0P2_9ASTR
MSKVLQERGFGSLPSLTKTNPRDQVKSISTTIEADSHSIRHIGSSQYAVSTGLNSTLLYKSRQNTVPFPSRLDNHYCKEEEGNYGPKFTKAYGASHINNTTAESEKEPKGFTLPNAFLMYLRRNQGDDLMPTIEEGEVIEEFRTRDEDLDIRIDDYPSYCDDDKKIHIDCAYNLKFSCMIRFEFAHVNFYLLFYVNVMSRKFHNLIMQNKMVYKGDNVVGALINVFIFVGTFSVMTDFAYLEDMDAYRDKGRGDIIVGEPFLREVGIKAKRFKGIITLYNGDDEVTYQMVRSHPRFKNHTNEQCNKIPPLLKVSEKEVKNRISHAYQNLKRFSKGVLNLGPNYIRNAKTEEWLTRGHVSVHETK